VQLRDYWVVISKRWWLILLIAFAATLGSYGFSKLQEPVYRSTIKLTVTPSRMDYGLTMVIESLLRQYSERLRTDKIAEAVNARLQLDLPTEKLKGKVRVSPVPEDYILMVTVDDSDPNRARDIAYALADEFVNQQQILMAPVNPTDRIEVSILDRPTPGELFYPKTRQFALAAAALGLVIGLLLAFLLEYLDDTLKTADDVERFASLSVLGAIPVVSSVTPNGSGSGTIGAARTLTASRGG
jgi:capsular polysaccharide biosynthesis protein